MFIGIIYIIVMLFPYSITADATSTVKSDSIAIKESPTPDNTITIDADTLQKSDSVLGTNTMKSSAQTTISSRPQISMSLPYGVVKIELYPEKAPHHVERIILLTNNGFFNNLSFHRVIPNFIVQTGDPLGNGMGGSSYPDLKAEFNDIKHVRGVVSMARAASPDSANSQFFIMLGDAPHLDGQYTAFGMVIEGMEFIDKIKQGSIANNGLVSDPDRIQKMEVIIEK